jgi:site-specific DNA-methyltransferase (cytosine-N4-specific)
MSDTTLEWFSNFAPLFKDYLSDTGSIVIELGNSWEHNSPEMSVLTTKTFLKFLEKGNLHLCQKFIWNNPAKLPSPAQWVNVDRVRVKDSYTELWWMSKTPNPKANNKNVLTPYSNSMKNLIKNRKYNSGIRPSEHNINSESFFIDNGGAIPSNVITAANTSSNSPYFRFCKEKNIPLHPARMPEKLVEFFIKFTTNPGDTILEPFGGSNTTGSVAESLNRKWITIEGNEEYIKGSMGRFDNYIISNSFKNG